jgi:hypothetical protein
MPWNEKETCKTCEHSRPCAWSGCPEWVVCKKHDLDMLWHMSCKDWTKCA